jgi:hypothetical protein
VFKGVWTMRAYIAGSKEAEEPGREHLRDYWFALTPDQAGTWDYRTAAEDARSSMERLGVTIPTRAGIGRLTDFKIEEHGEKFVISCEGPFEPRA